jgi:hypothetical protein
VNVWKRRNSGTQGSRLERRLMPLSGHCLMPVWGDPANEAASDGWRKAFAHECPISSRSSGDLALGGRDITNPYGVADQAKRLAVFLPSTSAPVAAGRSGVDAVHVAAPVSPQSK